MSGERVVEPARAYAPIAILCAVGAVIVAVLGRPPAPTLPVAIGLGVQAALCLFLYAANRLHPLTGATPVRVVALVAIGLLTALPGYFFGPNSGFAAVVALALSLAGMVSGREDNRLEGAAGWIMYLALAGGQALVLGLVMAHLLPDVSLSRVLLPGRSDWQHALAHAAVQGIYLAAFMSGRVLQRRYQTLVFELDKTLRTAALREALLDEARAHYRRALAVGKDGMFSGQTLGDYKLGDVIGRGGTGEVYEAKSVADGSRAAVKVLRGDRLDEPEVVARFVEETVVSRRVQSPYVARVYAAGGLEEQIPYVAMERLSGETLEQRGRLDLASVRRLLTDLCSGLEAIHAAGLLHLDVSPRNVVRDGDGWKLIDFGTSKAASDQTRAVGTPFFIAPERLVGQRPDARADLFGVAACVHFAVTGRPPFAGDPMRAALESAPIAIDLPPELHRVLAKGLSRTPANRFDSVAALRDALLGALDGQSVAIAPPPEEPPAQQPLVRLPALEPSESQITVVSQVMKNAMAHKMEGIYVGVTALCVGGSMLLALIARDRGPLVFAWGCMAGIVFLTWLDRVRTGGWERPRQYGPDLLIGALAVGPAYAFGLHSAFAAVLAAALFYGGAFSAADKLPWFDRRGLVLWGVCGSQLIMFVLLMARVVPDAGNVPILHGNAGRLGPIAGHLMLQVLFVTSFMAGYRVDLRYQDAMAKLEAAAREAAHKEALLATARAEIDRALAAESDGLFSGQQVGRYRAVRLIGRGGMGEVYEAIDAETQLRVALKLVRRDRVADPRSLRMFANEASAVARVRSPFVAEVLEVGATDLPFIAMEFIEGRSLASLLRQHGRLAFPELRQLVGDVGRGLHDVHTAGILHRDLKPQNIMLTQASGAPRWKLVDFGVAKLMVGPWTDNLVAGTLPYMSPEQAAGGRVDTRSDLYSFCLILFRALTGCPAFTEADRAQMIAGKRSHSPPDPRRYVDLSMELELVLRIGLAQNPDDRFTTAVEMREAIEAAFDERLSDEWHEHGIQLLAREPWSDPFIQMAGYPQPRKR